MIELFMPTLHSLSFLVRQPTRIVGIDGIWLSILFYPINPSGIRQDFPDITFEPAATWNRVYFLAAHDLSFHLFNDSIALSHRAGWMSIMSTRQVFDITLTVNSSLMRWPRRLLCSLVPVLYLSRSYLYLRAACFMIPGTYLPKLWWIIVVSMSGSHVIFRFPKSCYLSLCDQSSTYLPSVNNYLFY